MDKHIKQRTAPALMAVSLLALLPHWLQAQSPSAVSQAPAQAQQVPLSGRQSTGSVGVQQTSASGSGASSVDTINTTVQVQGPYQDSVPDASASGHVALTLPDAIRRALQFNLGAIASSNTSRQSRAERLQALSHLLPNISGSMSYTETRTDLEAEGLTGSAIPAFGSALPRGLQYHYYDARGTASQTIFDGTALNNYRSSQALEEASKLSQKDARELVVLAAGGQYLRTLSSAATVASEQVQVQYSQSSYDQAAAQYSAGTRSAVDTQKTLVELQTEQQRLSSDRADLRKQQLILLRVIGLPLRVEISLDETLGYVNAPVPVLDDVLHDALEHRQDLQASAQQLKAAEKALSASRYEWVPSASASGFYGIEGVTPKSGGVGIFGITGTLNVPIWNGGRTHADVEQATAGVAQRRAEYQDQQQLVELDVRNALIDFQVSTEQVRVAESNRKLATDTLKQSQDRYSQGVATSVEVVQSTETLASAESDYVNSLYSYNVARLSLARATGTLETEAPNLFKEKH